PGVEAFDLARTMKPRASIWEIFPFAELALQGALLLCAFLFLNGQARALDGRYRAVEAETGRHPWMASVPDAALEKEKKDLEQRTDAVRSFLESRILWTSHTEDLAGRLPDGIVLASFHGVAELGAAGKKGAGGLAKRSLILRLAAPIAPGGPIPEEIDGFL